MNKIAANSSKLADIKKLSELGSRWQGIDLQADTYAEVKAGFRAIARCP